MGSASATSAVCRCRCEAPKGEALGRPGRDETLDGFWYTCLTRDTLEDLELHQMEQKCVFLDVGHD